MFIMRFFPLAAFAISENMQAAVISTAKKKQKKTIKYVSYKRITLHEMP